MDVRLGIPGLFNVDNALAALCVCSFLGLPKDKIVHALEHIRVNGRMEIVHTSSRCTVLVDYAHNAVSMESLLASIIPGGWWWYLDAAATVPRTDAIPWVRLEEGWLI